MSPAPLASLYQAGQFVAVEKFVVALRQGHLLWVRYPTIKAFGHERPVARQSTGSPTSATTSASSTSEAAVSRRPRSSIRQRSRGATPTARRARAWPGSSHWFAGSSRGRTRARHRRMKSRPSPTRRKLIRSNSLPDRPFVVGLPARSSCCPPGARAPRLFERWNLGIFSSVRSAHYHTAGLIVPVSLILEGGGDLSIGRILPASRPVI